MTDFNFKKFETQILQNKIKNIETVVKMLDAQNDVVKKMLKDDMDGMSDKIQNMS